MLFEEEEERGDRERKFRWKHLDNQTNLTDMARCPDDEVATQESDDENEIEWRRLRYEREQLLKQQLEQTGAQDEVIKVVPIFLLSKHILQLLSISVFSKQILQVMKIKAMQRSPPQHLCSVAHQLLKAPRPSLRPKRFYLSFRIKSIRSSRRGANRF